MKTTLLIGPDGAGKTHMARVMLGQKNRAFLSAMHVFNVISDQITFHSHQVGSSTQVIVFDDVVFPRDLPLVKAFRQSTSCLSYPPGDETPFETAPEILFISQNTFAEVVAAFGSQAEVAKAVGTFAEAVSMTCKMDSLEEEVFSKISSCIDSAINKSSKEIFDGAITELNQGYENLKNNLKSRWPSLGNQQSFDHLVESVAELTAMFTMASHNIQRLYNLTNLHANATKKNWILIMMHYWRRPASMCYFLTSCRWLFRAKLVPKNGQPSASTTGSASRSLCFCTTTL